MSSSDQIRNNITVACRFVGMSERGEIAAAEQMLDSLSFEDLKGAFISLAGGYAGMAHVLGLDLRGLDDDEVIELYVERAEWALKMLKGRMGYN